MLIQQIKKLSRYFRSGTRWFNLAMVILTCSCETHKNPWGEFFFFNKTQQSVTLTCFYGSIEQFSGTIKHGTSVPFSSYMINSFFSFPNQMDSIIIESEGKRFIEVCRYGNASENTFPNRTCTPDEGSIYNGDSYEIVNKKRSDAPDYYFYFTEEDLTKLK